jgi:type III secretion protein S
VKAVEHQLIVHVLRSLQLFSLIVMPPLVAAIAVGIIIGILQTATQIQDQTIGMAAKVIAVGLVLAAMAPYTFVPLAEHAKQIFTEFPSITK